MNNGKSVKAPVTPTQSTLLIPRYLIEDYGLGLLSGRALSDYLGKMLSDPLLDRKLKLLIPVKWKKEYQKKGQDLVKVNFYPREEDWAFLSILSNATGFSRCYLFVFLLLFHLEILDLESEFKKKELFFLKPFIALSNPDLTGIIQVCCKTMTLTRDHQWKKTLLRKRSPIKALQQEQAD